MDWWEMEFIKFMEARASIPPRRVLQHNIMMKRRWGTLLFSLCGWPLRKRHFQGVCSQFNFGASQSGGRERGRKGSNYTTTTTSEKIKMNFVLLFFRCFIFSLVIWLGWNTRHFRGKCPFNSLWRMKPQTVDITSRDFLAEHYLIITEKIRTSWRWCNPARDKDHHHKNRWNIFPLGKDFPPSLMEIHTLCCCVQDQRAQFSTTRKIL